MGERPFRLTERNGKLFGRGVADNKGNIIARIAAVDALREVFKSLPIKIKFLVEGEEIGSPHLSYYIKKHKAKLRSDGGDLRDGLCG